MSLIILLLIAGGILLLLSARLRQGSGLPPGKVIAADTSRWGLPQEKPLYDGVLGLVGKPDYLIHQAGEIIPVEVKSSRTPRRPHASHLFQLTAYCLLVEKVYRRPTSRGIIHYPDRTFEVQITSGLRSRTLELLGEMHLLERASSVARSHQQPDRCRSCGFRNHCDQQL